MNLLKKLLLIPLGLSLISAFNLSKKEFLFSDNQQISLVAENKEEKDFQKWLDEKSGEETELECIDCNLTGSGNLSRFKNLETIYFQSNKINTINLKENINLKIVNFDLNQLTEINGLENLVNLIDLKLFHNQLTEINGLDKLTKLTKLNLTDNQLTEIYGLDKLTKLTQLSLGYNQFTEINGLNKLVNLIYLNLKKNQLQEIDLVYNINLEGLNLQKNKSQLKICLNEKYKGKDKEIKSFLHDQDAKITYEDPSSEPGSGSENPLPKHDQWLKKHFWWLITIPIVTIILVSLLVLFIKKRKGGITNL